MEQRYLTVGDLAARVGVTVRTVQFYDQQGLMPPAARGAQNQRLYLEEDVERMRYILTLKYLGCPLTEIRELLDRGERVHAPEFQSLLHRAVASAEEEFQELLRRMNALRALAAETADGSSLDWNRLSRVIEEKQGDGHFSWQIIAMDDSAALSGDADGTAPVSNAAEPPVDGELDIEKPRMLDNLSPQTADFAEWHSLIADTIMLFSSGQSPLTVGAQEAAQRYVALKERASAAGNDTLILMDSATHGSGSSFDQMRSSVIEYLEAAIRLRERGNAAKRSPNDPGEGGAPAGPKAAPDDGVPADPKAASDSGTRPDSEGGAR